MNVPSIIHSFLPLAWSCIGLQFHPFASTTLELLPLETPNWFTLTLDLTGLDIHLHWINMFVLHHQPFCIGLYLCWLSHKLLALIDDL